MTDLVYILGSGSLMNNLELRYSLASVERYMKGVRKIYIVGDYPGFTGNFTHLPEMDRGNKYKQISIRMKIEVACQMPFISNPFLCMQDDYVLTKEVDASTIPYYYNTNLTRMWLSKRKNGYYKMALHNTLISLSEKDLPINHYDIHTPILYHKDKFMEAMRKHSWKEGEYVIKSLYCNTVGVTPVLLPDPKVVPRFDTVEDVEQEIKDWFMFSFDDTSLGPALLKYLEVNYPEVKKSCVQ